ncbi:MAG TPA: BON domain-containing protein [Gemmatimonadaceae bacterium]|jgi:osmotically-inducible protein OsmY|nr:BON domain-containing protein [Gemmatimonadaceae bacterium]
MKSDSQLQQDVLAELKWEPSVGEKEIGVAVKDAVVTLTGFVDSYAQKYAAERVASSVSGVRAVAEDLEVRLAGESKRTDTELAHAAVNALKWDIQVPNDKIKATVEKGWIELRGEVEWQYQKWAAESAIRNLTGVKGVSNFIAVKPKKVSAYEVSTKIKDSLRRNAEVEADHIAVEAKDGTVVLRGTVRSFAEREEAEAAAWRAPGVRTVEDKLTVAL